MNKIYLSFKVIKDSSFFEAIFDQRLSFEENFKLLNNIKKIGLDADNIGVYDPCKKIIIDGSVPLKEFCFNDYMLLYLF